MAWSGIVAVGWGKVVSLKGPQEMTGWEWDESEGGVL